MIWPFKRKPKRPAYTSWMMGDIAESVVSEWECYAGPNQGREKHGPLKGQRFMVRAVVFDDRLQLRLIGWTGKWDADCFRKITLTDTGADRKVGKRKPVGVDA